jgi:hypothetical protein
MALITIETSSLTSDQKERIGSRIITTLQQEGFAPGSIVVLFRPEQGDIYLEGLLIQGQGGTSSLPQAPIPIKAKVQAAVSEPEPSFKTKARRSKPELEDMKKQLINALQEKGSLSSFEAQVALDLKDCDWAPATLRRLFTDLEDAKLIAKSGQKRGTRYLWKGIVNTPHTAPAIKLVKAESDEG